MTKISKFFEKKVNFESIFENFVISKKSVMVDEVNITQLVIAIGKDGKTKNGSFKRRSETTHRREEKHN